MTHPHDPHTLNDPSSLRGTGVPPAYPPPPLYLQLANLQCLRGCLLLSVRSFQPSSLHIPHLGLLLLGQLLKQQQQQQAIKPSAPCPPCLM